MTNRLKQLSDVCHRALLARISVKLLAMRQKGVTEES
jgi:hypothetical protein